MTTIAIITGILSIALEDGAGAAQQNKNLIIHFDRVYMNSDVWLNDHHLDNHAHGYSPFYYDLTYYLKPVSRENILAVRIKNEGKNAR
ncbi:MAG: hypothetical protein ICV79_13875 [Flavisolibacter sp.]|nr:hypothetical protein [Flavisolibacter sp.]